MSKEKLLGNILKREDRKARYSREQRLFEEDGNSVKQRQLIEEQQRKVKAYNKKIKSELVVILNMLLLVLISTSFLVVVLSNQ